MFFRTRRKARRPRPATLGIESLEQRLPLAGDVTVAFKDGTLTITGDAQGNQVWVAQRGDKTVVAPSPWEMNGATRLRFGAAVGLSRVEFGGVQAVVVELRGGNDVLVMGGPPSDPLNLRALTVNLGAGNNSLSMQGMTVNQNATVRAGDGIDSVRLEQVTVGGATSIQTGNGDSLIELNQSWLSGFGEIIGGRNNDRIQVYEVNALSLQVRTGEGNDSVSTPYSAIAIGLDIATGPGDDHVALEDIRGTGVFIVNTADGNDSVIARSWSPGAQSLTVSLGNGQNDARFINFSIGGPITVTGGAGQDFIETRIVDVQGRLTIDAGDGNNTIRMRATSALSGQITTGQGVDRVSIDAGGRYTGELRLRTGAGADTVWILGIEVGMIDVDLGAGDDVILLAGGHFHRRTRFDGGVGRDTVRYVAGEFGTKFFTGFEAFVLAPA